MDTVTGSSCHPLHQVLRRVSWQLADLAVPSALTVVRSVYLTCRLAYLRVFIQSSVYLPHAVDRVRFCFGTVCDFLFVYEISREQLNGFAPNSHERRVWSLARTSLKAKVTFAGLGAVCFEKKSFL